MSVNLIKSYVRYFLSNLQEGPQKSISGQEMVEIIEKLSDDLRNAFPDVAFPVTRAGRNILPFSLKQIWTMHPPIYFEDDEIIFGMHLGNGYTGEIPDENDLMPVMHYMTRVFGSHGWYVHNWEITSRGETLKVNVFPEFTEEMSETPFYLYHLTDKKNLKSILSNGLTPSKSKNPGRNYNPRVYLFADENLLKQQIKQNIEAHHENGIWHSKLTSTLDMAVVVIDPSKLKQGTRFHRDPEFSGDQGAVYTFTHIPPGAIDHTYEV